MESGHYRCKEDGVAFPYEINIRFKETEKSYILKLLDRDMGRYPPAHIEMLFKKGDVFRISKAKGGHPIQPFSNGRAFVIYPFQAGCPYVFEKVGE